MIAKSHPLFSRLMRFGALVFSAVALGSVPLAAQTASTPKAGAPIDLSGYWVSLVSEDWRYRMMTAPKGDYYSIPLNAEGRRVADSWDPQKDIAAGKQCMSYGAANIMRVPERLHITWDNDTALKLETDAGRQTRMFSFVPPNPRPASAQPSMQGTSVAQWQTPQSTRAYNAKIPAQDPNTPGFPGNTPTGTRPADTRKLGGTLKVVTTNLLPGYLRNNGVPYSANTVLTEYYDVHEREGVDYLIVMQVVEDPQYLDVPWVTTNNFKREANAAKWDPRPCELILPSK